MSQVKSREPRDALASLRIERSQPAGRSGWRRLSWLLVAGLFILGVPGVGLLVAQSRGWLSVTELITPRLEVRLGTVVVETGRSADATVVATGYLESRRQAMIGARAPGRIQLVHVEEGTRVQQGETLAVLEHADLDAALAAANAMLERSLAEVREQEVEIARSKRDYDRAEALFRAHSLADSEYDRAKYQHELALARLETLKAAVSQAKSRVQEAEQQKENMFIRAPFDGTVISKDAEVGESILPGGMGEASGRGSVVTIADLDHLEIECDVKEDFISRVSAGQPTEVAVDAVPDRRYQGRVRKIIPMGDRARATIKVKVEILDADERLFPEMSGTAFFLPESSTEPETTAPRRIFCPTAAISGDGEERVVWLVDQRQRVRRVPIEFGPSRGGQTEVTSGLSGGERVVLEPPREIQDGQLVKVAQ